MDQKAYPPLPTGQPPQYVSNIYVQQPTSANNQYVMENQREWSFGLFDCCSDCIGCLFAYFLTPCYLYKIFTDANEGCCDCLCSGLAQLRTKVRVQRGIKGSLCGDACASVWCPICVMVQISNEVKNNPVPKAI